MRKMTAFGISARGSMSILGLDVGTTGTKAIAFDLEGNVLASAYREYPLNSPRPGWLELDPEHVWRSIRAALGEVAQKTRHDPIRSLGISAQGEACHGVSKSGECLTPSIVTFDARTADMPEWWLQHKPRFELAKLTGMPLHGMYSINKILWMRQNLRDAAAHISKFLCYEDFVHLRLGLVPAISQSLAARTMALNATTGDWADDILSIAGIDRSMLARVLPSGRPVGNIPDAVADEIGLPRGIVVGTGGHDQPASALGAGIVEGGEAVYATGTVECICPIFDTYTMTPEIAESNLCCYPSCIPGLYTSIAFNFTGGSLLKWYRDNFAQSEAQEALRQGRDVYDIICENVMPAAEDLLVLPHFTVTGTPHFDTESRGVILGLTLGTRKEDLVAGILSGVTYEMKLNLELLRTAGVSIRQLRAVGGGAKSPVWVQRKADIMGVPVAVLAVPEAAALGVALLGAQAAGIVEDARVYASAAAKIVSVIEPDRARNAAFEERFALYREVYPAVRSINHRLAKLQK
jgi:xylulokinase